ncbi:MAG: phenylacetate--CoA ligase family protein [Bacteroidetes bacterium]|nr:phenylacetate--CoA ligase family protein [Bacteroidota bacterium]
MNYLYQKSPIFVQNLVCTYKGLKEKNSRFGEGFQEYYDFLLKTQWYTRSQIEEYQISRIRKLVKYVYENVPYYNELFKSEKLLPSDINTLLDLNKIPVLTKEIVRNRYRDLINPKYNKPVVKAHTSGSTGKALNFLFSKDAIKYRWALWFRHRERFGIVPHDAYATFTGLVAVPINQKNPPFWRENYAMKQTIFTMHHISSGKIESIVNRLNQGGFAYYSGYPSILFSLATLIEAYDLKITASPKVIFTGAEALLDNQRKIISRVFNCLVTDQYGFSEGAGNASRCEHDLFHEDYEYGILECNNEKQNGIYKTGEILGTGFTNLAMPFIRYKIGDTATWVDKKCVCGRRSKTIFKIEGRNEDYVITPEGNKILRFDYIFKRAVNIQEAQIVQCKLGEITIRIVKRPTYSNHDENNLLNEVAKKVSPSLKVKFEYLSEIERENTGKYRSVRSYVK